MRLQVLRLLVPLGLVLFVFPAAAATRGPELLGEFRDWNAYSARDSKSTFCFVLSQPQTRLPAELNRDPAYFFVKSMAGASRGEISIELGFPTTNAPRHFLTIGDQRFALMAENNHAWSGSDEDTEIIKAMRMGSSMVVETTSRRGNVTTDTYSLMGISAALDRIQRCQ